MLASLLGLLSWVTSKTLLNCFIMSRLFITLWIKYCQQDASWLSLADVNCTVNSNPASILQQQSTRLHHGTAR